MPGPPKLTRSKTERLFAAISRGESLTAASRMIDISPQAIYKRAAADSVFAARLAAARRREALDPLGDLPAVDDWRQAAAWLEADGGRWWLPDDPDD
jgi:hypothetical protein